MSPFEPQPLEDTSNDETVETPLMEESSLPSVDRPQVALVAGSGPAMAMETASLLRDRLRVAATLLASTTAFFIFRNWLGLSESDDDTIFTTLYQALAIVILTGATVLLWTCIHLSLVELRAIEVAVFGILSALFIVLHFSFLQRIVDPTDGLEPVDPFEVKYRVMLISLMWFAFILIYSTFIPNTTMRGLVVMALMALAPVAIIASQGVILPAIGRVVFWGDMIIVAVAMAIAYTLGAYGMYKLGALRREAFKARLLGQYRLTEQIGSGGMGEVYLAEHQLLKRPCAIKLIRPSQSTDAKALARFEREVRLMAKLSHWNSVEVFDYGRAEDGTFYYAMEFLPGLSLQEVVERQGPVQPERAVHLLRQVCYALVEAHTIGLVHRDIKPSNIIASKRGGIFDVAKLLDFGLARSLEDTGDIKLTQEGAIAGSPFYLAPERFLENVEADVRGDVYSLGAVAYFLLTGQPPFRGDKPLKVMMAHAREEVVPPSQRNAAIPADLEAIVLRCLVKNPQERYQDATELEHALAACACADHWSQDMAAHWWVGREEMGEMSTSESILSPAEVGTQTIS